MLCFFVGLIDFAAEFAHLLRGLLGRLLHPAADLRELIGDALQAIAGFVFQNYM
jgi:hypothetical protein